MTDGCPSLEPAHFQRIYDVNMDPWNYHRSDYEIAKRDATIAALEGRRFASAIEVGCSIGALTRQLADHCDQLLAVDFIEKALSKARAACADKSNVTFKNARIPADWPKGQFDLIVLSEVLYFLSDGDNLSLVRQCASSLVPDGEILMVNWLGKSLGDPCSGDDAAARFIAVAHSHFHVASCNRLVGFRIDKLRSAPGTDGRYPVHL
jgi:2-polyprenyl-3-methyl-5-hydroxy-6-metoxy-1,4-benzoquinol methylase